MRLSPVATRTAIVCILATLSAPAGPLLAQELEWVGRIGSDLQFDDPLPGSVDTATEVVVSPNGDVHVLGTFEREVDFDFGPETYYLEAIDNRDVYVLTLTSDGDFVRALRLGGEASLAAFVAETDPAGNLYVGGNFSGTTDFDPGPGSFELTAVETTGYLLKLDAAGEFQWVLTFETSASSRVLDIAMDQDDRLLLCGNFQGVTDFDPGPDTFELTSLGLEDGYVAKLDDQGGLIWVVRQGGPANLTAREIAVDPGGFVFVAGSFEETADLDPGAGTFEVTSHGWWDPYVSRLTPDGDFVWGLHYGGWELDSVADMRVTPDGRVHLGGWFRSTVDFDPGPAEMPLTSAGYFDGYILVLDADGALVWVRQLEGTGVETLNALHVDGAGNVYTVGTYTPPVDFDPGPGSAILDEGESYFAYGFVWKLDSEGDFAWVGSLNGTTHITPNDVETDADGGFYSVGDVNGPADFDPGPGVEAFPTEFVDGFAMKLDQTAAGASPGAVPDGASTPGAPLTLSPEGDGAVTLQWEAACDTTDYAVMTGSLSGLAGGVYDHTPAVCSTGGATQATVDLLGDAVYLLVVPHSGQFEGSYGRGAGDAERPAAPAACYPQSIGACLWIDGLATSAASGGPT